MVGDLANDAEAETQAEVLGEEVASRSDEEVVAARSNEEVAVVPEEVVADSDEVVTGAEEVVAVRSNEEEVAAVPEADGGIVNETGDVVDIESAETNDPAASGDAVSADVLGEALAAIMTEASTM